MRELAAAPTLGRSQIQSPQPAQGGASPPPCIRECAPALTHAHTHTHTHTHCGISAGWDTSGQPGCGHWSLRIQGSWERNFTILQLPFFVYTRESQSPWHRTVLLTVDLTTTHDNPDLEAGSMSVLLCKAKAQEISVTCSRAQGVVAVGAPEQPARLVRQLGDQQ